MKCSNCGKETGASISMKGSESVEKEASDMCFDCIKEWLGTLTFVRDDGTLVRKGEVVGHREDLAKKK